MEGWQVAEANPVTLIVDPTRRIALTGFDLGDFGQALLWTGVVAVVSLGLAFRAYRTRVRGT